jgi:regulator of protease activity HflC (stomatin/prohibitin superfamily)
MASSSAAITHQPAKGAPDDTLPLYSPTDPRPEEEPKGMSCHPLSCCLQTLCCPFSLGATLLASCFVLPVQTEAVLLRYGKYERTIKEPGIHYSNVFGRTVKKISTKLMSMDLPGAGGARRTVMDKEGNPLVVSAVVTYQFVDSYKAAIDVANPHAFLATQGETVLRNVLARYPYETHLPEPSLRTHLEEVSDALRDALQVAVRVAGIKVHSYGLKEISYAPVVAAAMLKRQQAAAMVQARSTIVHGAVDIATDAVTALKQNGIELDEASSARLVSNLLTVICSDTEVQPTVPLS